MTGFYSDNWPYTGFWEAPFRLLPTRRLVPAHDRLCPLQGHRDGLVHASL
jgi:hypothetical protein